MRDEAGDWDGATPRRALGAYHPAALVGRHRVASVSLVMALALLGDSLIYVVLPLHAAALGLSPFQVGVLLSANRFIRMVTNTATSRLTRKVALRPLFTGATGLAALTTAMYALTPAFAALLLARAAWGLCFSALRLGCFLTVLGASTDRTRGRLMGAYHAVSRAGSFAAVVAGGALYDAFGYPTAILTMAAGTALALPLAAWSAPDREDERRARGGGAPSAPRPATDPADPPTRPVAARVGSRAVARLGEPRLLAVKWSGFALAFAGRGVVTATLALFLRETFGERFGPGGAIGVATLASWLIGVRWLSEIGLAAPLGALSDRIGRARSATGWLVLAGAALLTLALAPLPAVAVVAAVVLFVAASGLGAALDAAAGDLAPPGRRADVMSSYADWTDLGAAAGPLLALSLVGAVGLQPTYVGGAALLATGAVAVTLTFSRRGH